MLEKVNVRAKFTLLYGVAIVFTVLLVSGGIYYFVERALVAQIESHLRKETATLHEYLRHAPESLAKVADHGPIHFFRIADLGKETISSIHWKDSKFEVDALPGSDGRIFDIKTGNGEVFKAIASSLAFSGHDYSIVVAHDQRSLVKTMGTLTFIILVLLPLAIIMSLGTGYLLAGRVLAPVNAIIMKAEEINADNLSARLPVGERVDEFNRLSIVMNQTFERIEDSFAKLKRFTADASHELRTPLAVIRSTGETALRSAKGDVEWRETVASILEETDRLRQTIDSLMTLSRADSGRIEIAPESIDLTALAGETVEFLGVLAEEKMQTIEISSAGQVLATIDRGSARQALINLLDNAIKYSPPASTIAIAAGFTDKDEPSVSISDAGMGIPPEHLPHIFDRFYRVDKGRSREIGGAGLGLSIAAWAVAINGGRILVRSEPGKGSEFTVIFPKRKNH